jgi:hypothetical protein
MVCDANAAMVKPLNLLSIGETPHLFKLESDNS